MPKIFCIGFQKTGTTSLGLAFEKLGFTVGEENHDLLTALQQGDFEKIKTIAAPFDVLEDNPWPVLFRQLDEYFPGSKFILSVRNEETWIRSVVNHFNGNPREMHRFIYGVPFPSGNEAIYLDRYRKHNQEVIAYFKNRPEDLLIIDLEKEDAWTKLCPFLKMPVPSFPFPHANRGVYTIAGKWWKYVWKRVRARWRDVLNRE